MREKIKKAERKYLLIRLAFLIPAKINRWIKNQLWSDKKYVISQYKKKLGKTPDLENPVLFTEKLQWLKLFDKNPLYTICADKYRVREYVNSKIGNEYLIPLLFFTDDPDEINFKELPENYIIKTNHTSGYNLICNEGKIKYFNKIEDFSESRTRKILRKWLKKNAFYENREWEYKLIPPRIVIEELLADESGNELLNDYKIHCFNGIPLFIQTIFDRSEGIKENWFTTQWEEMDLYYFSPDKKHIERPSNLENILDVSAKLSEDFNYVRVDLYSIRNKIYFGELTFHPYSGLMNFKPRVWDLKLGEILQLKTNGK